jgi:hypothetical protein
MASKFAMLASGQCRGEFARTAFKDLLPMREKVAKWHTFVVEGVPQ